MYAAREGWGAGLVYAARKGWGWCMQLGKGGGVQLGKGRGGAGVCS